MEEKERYSYLSCYKKRVFDNETNKIIDVIGTLNQQDKHIKELEESLYNLASAVNKESCYSCPIRMGGGESCEDVMCRNCKNKKIGCFFNCKIKPKEDSDECIEKIVKFYIKQAKKELKGSKYGNKEIEQI